MSPRVPHMLLILGVTATVGACAVPTDPGGDAVNVRGSWTYVGEQAVPRLTIDGVLSVSRQSGEDITGTASWEVRDPVGGITLLGGNLIGQAIGEMDVDFDVVLAGGPRRHLARVVADTMTGVWLDPSGGASGNFRAVRSAP